MIFQFATALLAGCVSQAAANIIPSAEMVGVDVVSSPSTARDLLSASTRDNVKPRKHRLLQKFKNRRKLAYDAQRHNEAVGGQADLGILSSKPDTPRFLQDYDYYCPRDTCPSELCDCADNGGSLEDCTEELQNVCRAGRLGDCVFKDYVKVYEEVYCPFVACTVEGFREQQCDCAFYDLYCSRLSSDECSSVLKADEEDKMPFFGCDETELKNVCDEATACKGRGDLQGLPDLGTWKGSVTTGMKSSGESVGGRNFATVVTVLSVLWLMVNV